METFYTAYTKVIQNKSYYFVKKYLRFSEYAGVADAMEGYGMHMDFNKACSIAGLEDPIIKKQLMDEILATVPQAKVIDLKQAEIILTKKMIP